MERVKASRRFATRATGFRRTTGPFVVARHGLSMLTFVIGGILIVSGCEPHRGTRLEDEMRFVRERFDGRRALEVVDVASSFFRVRGNAGYQAVLDEVAERLRVAGWSEAELHRWELGPERPTWRPREAHLWDADGQELVGFEQESEPDRTCLLIGSRQTARTSYRVIEIETAFRAPSEARDALIKVASTDELRRVAKLEVGGVLFHALLPVHRGNPEAIPFQRLPDGLPLGFSLSARSWTRLTERVSIEIDVEIGAGTASTLEARLPGRDGALPALVLVAHVDEPGANDNASGVAVLLETMLALRVRAPLERTVIALWGQEFESARAWLERTEAPAVGAALVLDMVGESAELVGAPFLVERAPDPGALWRWPPDEPSSWGGGHVDVSQLEPNFLSDVFEDALRLERLRRPWLARTHPFEGGSDHQSFLERGIPAILLWHFPDDAYHTNRDTMLRVSVREMERVAGVAGGATLLLARSDPTAVFEVSRAVERSAELRYARVAEYARQGGADRDDAARALVGWADWYDRVWERFATWTGRGVATQRERNRQRLDEWRSSVLAYPHAETEESSGRL